MSLNNLPQLRDSAKLPVSTLDHSRVQDEISSRWQRKRKPLFIFTSLLAIIGFGVWMAMNSMRPYAHQIDIAIISQQLIDPAITGMIEHDLVDSEVATQKNTSEIHDAQNTKTTNQATVVATTDTLAKAPNNDEPQKTTVTPKNATDKIPSWRPDSEWLYWNPQDHPNIDSPIVRVFVVTIQARVTAYTPYDHAVSHPQWADGVVAWHPRRRKRHVSAHPYGLATDWLQFPGGSTFIRVPGYMPKSFPKFPEAFRVVDDKCGRARLDRRHGREPVIDVRYLTRHSAISGRGAWGMKHLNVEVIFPANFQIPASLQRYVVSAEWRTYENGDIIDSKIIPFR
ncbi:MAG: hypothetical protein HRU15_18905 [Planctomycetes bacterium]|nr:hypothetical protein [Planctomycetota bacterium]